MSHRTAAIIPAYNEAERIKQVLDTLLQIPELDAIVVVDDGSEDETGSVVASYLPRDDRLRLIALPRNRGKGAAMEAGVLACQEEQILCLDADLIGLQAGHVRALIRPVHDGECEMTIGVFRNGRLRTDWAHRITPWSTGQRCLSRAQFLSTPGVDQTRMGVELALTIQAREKRWRVQSVPMPGVTHATREEKRGAWPGLCQRWRMYSEVMICWLHILRTRALGLALQLRRSRRAAD